MNNTKAEHKRIENTTEQIIMGWSKLPDTREKKSVQSVANYRPSVNL